MRWYLTLAAVFAGCADGGDSPGGGPADAATEDSAAVDAAPRDAAPPDAAAVAVDMATPDLGPDAAPMAVEPGVLGAQVAAGRHLDAAWVGGRLLVVWYDPDARALRVARALRDAPLADVDWSRHTLAEEGRSPSVAVVRGRPAVAYHDAANGALRFALATSPAPAGPEDWEVHTIDDRGNPGAFADLRVASGQLAVAYHDAAEGELRVAFTETLPPTSSADWTLETVEADGDTGHFARVGLEPLSAAWRDATTGTAKYAVRGEDGWTVETVDEDGDPGHDLDLAGDLISWRDAEGGFLEVATRGDDGWQVEVVDQTGDTGGGSQLHRVYGFPVVTHLDAARGRIKRATRTGAGWQLDGVTPPEPAGGAVFLAAHPCGATDDVELGRHGGVFLYRDGASGSLRFTYDAEERSPWFLHDLGVAAADAVLLPGPGLLYADASQGNVRYAAASRPGPTDTEHWSHQVVGPGPAAQLVASAAGEGAVVAAWLADGAVHFMRGGGDEWRAHSLEVSGELELAGAVVVGDRPALAWRDLGDGAVRFARARTSTPAEAADWEIHGVEPLENVTGGAALLVADGRPALAWVAAPEAEGGAPTLRFAHAMLPDPVGSADWSRHDVELELDPGELRATVAAATVAGLPSVVVGGSRLHYAVARESSPTSGDDWQRHVAEAASADGPVRLTAVAELPAMLYGGRGVDTQLRLATSANAEPRGSQAWTFSRVDRRDGGAIPFRPAGISTTETLRYVAYRVGGCLAYGWASR